LKLIFNFLIAIFLLLPLEKICCQGHVLKTYCCYGAQWIRTAQSERSARLGTSLPGNETASFWNVMLLYKIWWRTVSQKKKTVWVNSRHALFSLLDVLTLEDGTDKSSWNVGKQLPLNAA